MSRRAQQISLTFQQARQLHGNGRLGDAEYLYRQILQANPRHADALHGLGMLALQSGHREAAEDLITQAIKLKPSAEFRLTLANAWIALNRPRDAVDAVRTVLSARGNDPAAWQTLGHALSDSGQAEEAVTAYRNALRLRPDLPDIRNNLGSALRQAGDLAAAEAELRQAPAEPFALVNLSSVQKERGRFADAEATLRQALRQAPDHPVLRYNWALLMLLLGRTAEAWDGWEQRFAAGAVPAMFSNQPQWDGQDPAGRAVLVHAEQGLGDTIQFCRYLSSLRNKVAFVAPPRLARLLSSQPDMPSIIADGDTLPPFDLVCPLLSLPARTDVQPVPPPYLFAEPQRVTRWGQQIGNDGLRIGIAWQGNPARHEDKGRSIPLAAFAPLAQNPGVRLISLQKQQGEAQLAAAPFRVDVLPGLDDGPDAFLDTAAVMQVVDLIVTSDTSIAHLAGALGRPVWLALRHVPDWRWGLDRPDTPWYPTMRLFRQAANGDWAPVFQAMAEALAAP